MATDRKKIIKGIIIGVLGVGVLWGIIYWIFFRDKCDPDKKGFTKKGKISDKCFGKDAKDRDDKDSTPPPASTGCGGQWLEDNTFPLKKCMRGDKIRALQTALGFTGTNVDGKFGVDTLGAVQKKFNNRMEVTQQEYEALINPPDTTPKKGDVVYANEYMNLYKSKIASASNVFKSFSKDAKVGTVIDISTESGTKWAKIYYLEDEGYYYAPLSNLRK